MKNGAKQKAHILNTWTISIKETESEAVKTAKMAESGIHKISLSVLSNGIDDKNRAEYLEIKDSLINIADLDSNIEYSYILARKNDKVYYIADSEPENSPACSTPGMEYGYVNNETVAAFNGKIVSFESRTDSRGTRFCALIPMKDINTDKVIAVFGMDYNAETWYDVATKNTISAAVISCSAILIIFTFYSVFNKNKALKCEKAKLEKISDKLKESETLFRTVFEQAPIGIAVMKNYRFYSDINPAFEKIVGRSKDELLKKNWSDITHPDDIKRSMDYYYKFMIHQINEYTLKKRYVKPDGAIIWINLTVAPLEISKDTKDKYHLCLVEDIDSRKKSEDELKESERSKAVLLANLPGMAYKCSFDKSWTMNFVSEGCYELTGYQSESILYNKDISYNEIIAPEYRTMLWDKWREAVAKKHIIRVEYEIITASGDRKWVMEMGQGLYDESGNIEYLEGLIIDINDQKEKEIQIDYMLNHDYLTGLYNRKYYEERLEELDKEEFLPLTLMFADINGVRYVNDAFGYSEGDILLCNTSEVLENVIGSRGIVARIGGDEFGIALPNTSNEQAFVIIEEINDACNEFNSQHSSLPYEINLSVGYATKENISQDINDIDKAAETYLRNEKLLNNRSFHSDFVSSIMTAMYEKSEETEEHSQRLIDITKKIGEKLKLPKKNMSELELLSMLHDIGKVGVDDRILKKPGKLTEEEWTAMKTHTEIGYRIAKSVTELQPIAEYILTHHERWDGKGYPNGLKGEAIPIVSRILSVADAFDAMTNDRVYRKAMSYEEAIDEIKRNSGTQFDPAIVDVFLEIMEKHKIKI